MEPSASIGTGLDAVHTRRVELRESLAELEHALSTPATGREVVWGEAVHASLEDLAFDVAAHVDVCEGPGGLHQTVLATRPEFFDAVDALTQDHLVVTAEVTALLADSEPPVTNVDLDGLRDRATALIARLMTHRQQGADLVYAATDTDIGAGE